MPLSEQDRVITEAGVKLFCSVQLIYENAKLVQHPKMNTHIKTKLNKLRFECGELNKDFWANLNEKEEAAFQDKIRRIEKILEE